MASRAAIPNYALFGDEKADISPGFGHIETIAERSVLHDCVDRRAKRTPLAG